MDNKDGITASECIDDCLGVYADYTIDTKFPCVYDGLKKIARRILVCLHKKFKEEGPKLQKELSILGEVVKMHPHGDQSIGQAISVLAQPFTHIAPLVFSDCNLGNYSGDSPAASRYVDVAEADIARSLFFTDINPDMFKMVPCESEQGMEPAYLIPRIPTSLMVQSFAIALGYKTETFPMCISDLCKLTKEYIAIRAHNVDWMMKLKPLIKYTLPDFSSACVLRNSKELLREYRKGNFDALIVMDGTMEVMKDKIIIHTIPPNSPYGTVVYKEGDICAHQKNSWEAQNFSQIADFTGKDKTKDKKKKRDDAGTMQGNCICELRRGVNPFDVLSTLKKKMQFTASWKPDNHYVDLDGRMTTETPFTLLDKWYQVRYSAVLGDLKQRLNDMVDNQRRLLALIIVCDHTDEVYKIFKDSKDDKDTIPKLTKRFNLTRYQAAYLATLRFSQITAKGREDLEKELEQTKVDMVELQKQFNHVPELMIKSIEEFEKKFVNQPYKQAKLTFDLSRRCVVPKYIGAAIFRGNGHILLEYEDEMDQVLRNFNDPDEIEFKLFDKYGDLRAMGSDEPTLNDLPKYLRAAYVDHIGDQKHTACICQKGGALIAEDLIGKSDTMASILPIYSKFIAVHKNGMVSVEKVTEKIIRKNPSAGPTMKDVIAIGNGGTDVIIVHANSSQANNLVIERLDLLHGPSKLRKIPVGTWKILAITSPDTDRLYMNIPAEVRQRCATRHVVVDKIGELIKSGERLNLVFGRSTTKTDFELNPIRSKSSILKATRI